jgi:YbgC/YbaW family acyl-CoA thioester hydrolase
MEHFNFVLPYSVRVGDINYGGHVSNAVVLLYFQDARIGYLQRLGPYSEHDIGGCGIILPEAHLHYRAEMFLGDQLQIGVRIGELRNSAFVMEYRIERDGAVMAEGTTNLVAYDYQTRRPVRLPAAFRQAVENFEQGRLS